MLKKRGIEARIFESRGNDYLVNQTFFIYDVGFKSTTKVLFPYSRLPTPKTEAFL